MIGNLKPYPEMKESSVPWLTQIPRHWQLHRMKFLLRERNERGFPNEPPLAATQTKGVVRKENYENRTVLALKDLHMLKRVRKDDFVISLRSFQGGIEYAREQGIISPAYTILRVNDPSMHAFLTWLFKSRPFIEGLSLFVTGIRQGQNIDYEKLSRSELPVPPAEDRDSIVRFLDYADRRIRSYIRARQKLIGLLEEQKQAIVHRAVTRGVEPQVPLKHSGVGWLGLMPSHWDLLPLRRRWNVVDCKHLTVPFVDQGIPLASVREVQSFELDLATANHTTENWYEHLVSGGRQPRTGDLIYCRNVSVGACAFVAGDQRFAMGQDVCLIRSNTENGRFLNYFFHSPAMQRQLSLILIGSTFNRINVSEIKSLLIAVPPRREQDAIVRELDAKCAYFERTIQLIERQLIRSREYRIRLITEIVTGKLDVREQSKQLQELTAEPAPFIDLEEQGINDQETVEASSSLEDAQEEAEA